MFIFCLLFLRSNSLEFFLVPLFSSLLIIGSISFLDEFFLSKGISLCPKSFLDIFLSRGISLFSFIISKSFVDFFWIFVIIFDFDLFLPKLNKFSFILFASSLVTFSSSWFLSVLKILFFFPFFLPLFLFILLKVSIFSSFSSSYNCSSLSSSSSLIL